MNPKEFRIGNIVDYKYDSEPYHILEGVDSEFFYLKDTITIDYVEHDDVSGVPLTPEWLERLGAEVPASLIDGVVYVYKKFRLTRILDGCWAVVKVQEGAYLTKIKFVHEFQNLMYELTRSELTLK